MRSVICFLACASLALTGMILVGCDQQQQNPPTHSQSFSGGNGEFGESPASAGTYHDASPSTPTTQPAQ